MVIPHHIFSIDSRSSKTYSTPVMAQVSPDYNLAVVNPSLAKEWHPTKNGTLTPQDVAPKSHKRVWWICEKGHEWESAVAIRSRSRGCPYCVGRRILNTLADKRLKKLRERRDLVGYAMRRVGETSEEIS
jgi:hypothetical protein